MSSVNLDARISGQMPAGQQENPTDKLLDILSKEVDRKYMGGGPILRDSQLNMTEIEPLLNDPQIEIHRSHVTGRNVLIFAVECEHAELVTRLLAREDILPDQQYMKESLQPLRALDVAIINGNREIIELLLNHRDVHVYEETWGFINDLSFNPQISKETRTWIKTRLFIKQFGCPPSLKALSAKAVIKHDIDFNAEPNLPAELKTFCTCVKLY